MTRIIMCGCNGAMGRMITGIVNEDAEAEIVAGIDMVDTKEHCYPVFQKLADCDVEADALIDFSTPKILDDILTFSKEKKVPVVLCTTGYDDEQLAKIEEAATQTAVLKSANMSLGINTLLKLVQDAAKVFATEGFDVEIVEKHHNQKLDAPSGTALALADSINEAMGNPYEYVYDRSQRRQKRDKKELGISGEITVGQMRKLTSLKVSQVESLEGLQHAINLESLDIDYNEIRDLSPLKNLKKLKDLNYTGMFLIEMWADNTKKQTMEEAVETIRQARLFVEDKMEQAGIKVPA